MRKSLVDFIQNQKNALLLAGVMLFCVLMAYFTQTLSKGHIRFNFALVAAFPILMIAMIYFRRRLILSLVATAMTLVWTGLLALFPHTMWASVDQDIWSYNHSQRAAAFNLMYSIESGRLSPEVRQTIEECFDPKRQILKDFPKLVKQTYLPELISIRDEEPYICPTDALILTMEKALGAQSPFSSRYALSDADDLQKETHRVFMEVYAFMDFSQMRRAAFRDTGYLSLYDVWLLNRDYMTRRKQLESDFRMLTRKYGYYLWAFQLEG